MDFLPRPLLPAVGVMLTAAGLALWIAGVLAVQRAYSQDRLCTTGACRICRHPIYASWTVLVTPGVGILLNSWAFFVLSAAMYTLLRWLVRKEEAYLEQRFGDAYREYQRGVHAIIPFGRRGP